MQALTTSHLLSCCRFSPSHSRLLPGLLQQPPRQFPCFLPPLPPNLFVLSPATGRELRKHQWNRVTPVLKIFQSLPILLRAKSRVLRVALAVLHHGLPALSPNSPPTIPPLANRLQPHLAALLFLQQVIDSRQPVCILGSFFLQFSFPACPRN